MLLGLLCDTSSAPTEPITTSTDYLTRLNYGFIAVRKQSACISTGYWTHTFHFTLPTLITPALPNKNDSSFEVCSGYCQRLASVKTAINSLALSTHAVVSRSIDRMKALIPDIRGKRVSVYDRPRRNRGLVNAIGSLSHYLFGTAEESDVDKLRAEIEVIKGFSGSAASDASRVREQFSSAIRLQNERLDNINEVLRTELKSMDDIHQTLQAMETTLSFELDATAYLANETAVSMSVIDDVTQLELGIEALLYGQLSPRLLSYDQIVSLLNSATIALGQTGRSVLCLRTPQAVYANPNYEITRHENDFFLRLKLPISSYDDMDVYRTEIFELPVAGEQGLVTSLLKVPPFLIIDKSLSKVGELTQLPKHFVLANADIAWNQPYENYCMYELIKDYPEFIQTACDFSIRKARIQPRVVQLSQHVYALSNYSQLALKCIGNATSVSPTPAVCIPCLIQVECGCELAVPVNPPAVDILVRAQTTCDTTAPSDTTTLHAINLPVLQKFYDLANVSVIGERLHTASQLIEPEPFSWPLMSQNVTRLLAADTDMSYSLNKIATSLQNDSVVFHSPSEVMLYDLLQKQQLAQPWVINLKSWDTWAVGVAYVLILLLIISTYRLHRRLEVMCAVTIGALHSLPQTSAYGLRTTSTRSPHTQLPEPISTTVSNATVFLMEMFQDMRHFDSFTLTLFVTINIVTFALMTRAVYCALARRSYLFLQLKRGTKLLHVRVMTFPKAARHYGVILPSEGVKIELDNYCLFGTLTINTDQWQITNTLTDTVISAPKHVRFSPRVVRRLTDIMNGDYTVDMFIVHTHEYIFSEPQHSISLDTHLHDAEQYI
jgi:hypothetical protein